jgi:uncharacterized protein
VTVQSRTWLGSSRFATSGGLDTLRRENISRDGAMANGENENSVRQAAPTTARVTPVAPVWHTLLLLVVVIGLSALQARSLATAPAGRLPSRLTTYIFTIGFELVLLGYVWLSAVLKYRVPLRELIGGRWSGIVDFLKDVGVALLFECAVIGLLASARFLLHFSGAQAAQAILPRTSAELSAFLLLTVAAGFCEEVVFRGYLLRQFTAWTGSVAVGVILQAIAFGLAHGYQGWRGMLVISAYGAMFGILAVLWKSLRPGILQHCGQDALTGIAVWEALRRHIPLTAMIRL